MVKNDSGKKWSGEVVLKLVKDGKDVSKQEQELAVAVAGRGTVTFVLTCPRTAGIYEMIAELKYNGKPVRSYRKTELSN